MVVLIRCNDIVSDPRAMKYVRFMQKENIEQKRIAWDRDNTAPERRDTLYYKRKAGYNIGGLKAAVNKTAWMWFVFHSLKSMRLDECTLHCCDLDAVFPAVLYKKFYNKKARVIFDIFDWYSATLHRQNKFFLRAFKCMERISIKKSDYVIICEPERIEQIPYPLSTNIVKVLPNIPYFGKPISFTKQDDFHFRNKLITFSYVGGFAPERCLPEIVDLACEGKINLLIAGYGWPELEYRLNTCKCDTVKYFGKVEYAKGLQIMYNSDAVFAMYSISNPNNIYAAPNKFYESMMIGRPIFTSKGTIVERKVINLNIGYVSNESKEDILGVIKSMRREDMVEKGKTAHKLWDEKYCSFTDMFMRSEYLEIIK